MRAFLALLVVAGACAVAYLYTPHHAGEGVFQTLYMHLMPAPLVTDTHAPHDEQELVLEVPLPGFLAAFDVHGGATHGEASGGHERPVTALFNLQVFQIAAVVLIFVLFLGVPGYLRSGRGDWLTRVLTGWAMWIRDEMVYPVMGRDHGRRFLPYFLSLFFFIAFMNLLGLVPFAATATASIFVTAGLALTTLVGMVGLGMAAQGPVAFWKNLVPHVPAPLWPLLFVVELLGLFVKPFALMIRLFANMSGGHMVVLSFMGLIFFFAGLWGSAGGWAFSPLAVGFAVFILIIEIFVALLQAYIFTQLTILFLQSSIHPEH